MGVGGQHYALAALPSGKTRYPLYRRLGRPQGQSGRVWKLSPPPGFDPQTVQLIVSHYTELSRPIIYVAVWDFTVWLGGGGRRRSKGRFQFGF